MLILCCFLDSQNVACVCYLVYCQSYIFDAHAMDASTSIVAAAAASTLATFSIVAPLASDVV